MSSTTPTGKGPIEEGRPPSQEKKELKESEKRVDQQKDKILKRSNSESSPLSGSGSLKKRASSSKLPTGSGKRPALERGKGRGSEAIEKYRRQVLQNPKQKENILNRSNSGSSTLNNSGSLKKRGSSTDLPTGAGKRPALKRGTGEGDEAIKQFRRQNLQETKGEVKSEKTTTALSSPESQEIKVKEKKARETISSISQSILNSAEELRKFAKENEPKLDEKQKIDLDDFIKQIEDLGRAVEASKNQSGKSLSKTLEDLNGRLRNYTAFHPIFRTVPAVKQLKFNEQGIRQQEEGQPFAQFISKCGRNIGQSQHAFRHS